MCYSCCGDRFPKELKHFQNHPLFTGHTRKNDNVAIASLRSWQDLSLEKDVWVLEDGERGKVYATQYVFNGFEVLDALQEEAEIGVCA